MLHRNHTFLYRCIYTIHAAWFWQQVVGRISSCSTRYFYLYMYMYIYSDMHVKILHRHVHDYMYIDTCDISMYIYIHIFPCLGGFIWCLTINPWAHRFLVDLAAAKRHLAMVERCAIPSTSRRSIGRVGTALSGRSQCTGKLGIGHQNWCINDYVTTYSNKKYILYAHRFTKIAKIIRWEL